MAKFSYKAQGRDGSAHSGVLKAKDRAAARRELRRQGLTVTVLTAKTNVLQRDLTKTRVKRDELMHVSRQLAAFIRAGIPIFDSFSQLAEDSDSKAVRRVLVAISADLRAGSTLADAVDRHPKDIPTFYRGILRSAELTGRLDTVLDQLASYLERDLEARRKLKAAMIYPVVIAAMSLITVVVLTVFVLPKFEAFFASLNAPLPLPTRLLLGITSFIGDWGWLITAVAIVLIIVYLLGIRTTAGRRLRDRAVLRIPIIGETIKFAIIERFTRLLASMVDAGIELPEAMRVATESLNNLAFEDALSRARRQVIAGEGLAGPMSEISLFPSMAAQMIRVGEGSGTLDTQLEVAAHFYERELDYKIKKMTTIFEPLVIVVMGGIVGFVAVALVSAMYGIFRATNL